jgi:hypothetical protein
MPHSGFLDTDGCDKRYHYRDIGFVAYGTYCAHAMSLQGAPPSLKA